MRRFLLLACALGEDAMITASIDCSSGVPDSDDSSSTMTANSCRTVCEDVCSDVKDADTLSACLSNGSIEGCVFNVGNAEKRSVQTCVDSVSENPRIVLQVSSDDISSVDDSSSVNGVSFVAQLQDATLFQSCANKNVNIGVSSLAYNSSRTCSDYTGSASIAVSYTVSSSRLMVPITDALSGAWGSSTPLTVILQFQDATCGVPVISDSSVYFSIGYQSGFIDLSGCSSIDTVAQCRSASCNWCSWDNTISSLLPNWLPDWDWVKEARDNGKGYCGLNKTICKLTGGTVAEDAALPLLFLAPFAIFPLLTF